MKPIDLGSIEDQPVFGIDFTRQSQHPTPLHGANKMTPNQTKFPVGPLDPKQEKTFPVNPTPGISTVAYPPPLSPSLTPPSVTPKPSSIATTEDLVAYLLSDGDGNARITQAQQDSVRHYVLSVGLPMAWNLFSEFPILWKVGRTDARGKEMPADGGRDAAHEKLKAIAADLVRSGMPTGNAMLAAMERNPDLAQAASRPAILTGMVVAGTPGTF